MQYISLLFIGMLIVISVRGFLSNLMKVSFTPFLIKFVLHLCLHLTLHTAQVFLCSLKGQGTFSVSVEFLAQQAATHLMNNHVFCFVMLLFLGIVLLLNDYSIL